MKILVINTGSSSVKFSCFSNTDQSLLASGLVERIGGPDSRAKYANNLTNEGNVQDLPIKGPFEAMQWIAAQLTGEKGVMSSLKEIGAVGHRLVHGGEAVGGSVVVDERIKRVLADCVSLAPLHNPANLEGLDACERLFPGIPHVGVFDTAFHSTMPPRAYLYALPLDFYKNDHIRRYGFHGTSHKYVSRQAGEYFPDSKDLKLITCHLGNGCSISAVRNGQSIDTSMGLTPLEGLPMGARCGDLDPAVIFHLMNEKGLSADEVNAVLNKKSGFLGLADIGSGDMRDIEDRMEKGHEASKTCLEVFSYRIKKYIGSYMACLGGVDGLVFTAGIGEHSWIIRQMACEGLEAFGIILDQDKNKSLNHKEGEIQATDSRVKIMIIPTNEELEIALETIRLAGGEA